MQTFIDFDGTLFDTDRYIVDFMKVFNDYGITKEEFEHAKNNLFNEKKLFNINIITEYFINKHNLDKQFREKINSLLENSYVYNEVISCLETLKTMNNELYILTYGDNEFQRMKINSTDLAKYFKEIIISESDKSKLDLDYQNSIFIDNNPIETEKFYKAGAKKVIRIRRSSDKYSKINSNILEIIECEDFNQVVEFMKGDF